MNLRHSLMLLVGSGLGSAAPGAPAPWSTHPESGKVDYDLCRKDCSLAGVPVPNAEKFQLPLEHFRSERCLPLYVGDWKAPAANSTVCVDFVGTDLVFDLTSFPGYITKSASVSWQLAGAGQPGLHFNVLSCKPVGASGKFICNLPFSDILGLPASTKVRDLLSGMCPKNGFEGLSFYLGFFGKVESTLTRKVSEYHQQFPCSKRSCHGQCLSHDSSSRYIKLSYRCSECDAKPCSGSPVYGTKTTSTCHTEASSTRGARTLSSYGTKTSTTRATTPSSTKGTRPRVTRTATRRKTVIVTATHYSTITATNLVTVSSTATTYAGTTTTKTSTATAYTGTTTTKTTTATDYAGTTTTKTTTATTDTTETTTRTTTATTTTGTTVTSTTTDYQTTGTTITSTTTGYATTATTVTTTTTTETTITSTITSYVTVSTTITVTTTGTTTTGTLVTVTSTSTTTQPAPSRTCAFGTAFGYLDDQRSTTLNTQPPGSCNRWGWYNRATAAELQAGVSGPLYVGAGGNNIASAINVGTWTAIASGSPSRVTWSYNLSSGYLLDEVHIDWGCLNIDSCSPGQYTVNVNLNDVPTYTGPSPGLTFPNCGNNVSPYFIVHAAVKQVTTATSCAPPVAT